MVEGQDQRGPIVGGCYRLRTDVSNPAGLPVKLRLTDVQEKVVVAGSIMIGIRWFLELYEVDDG